MKVNLQLNKIQKFVIVETNDGLSLWGDPDAEFHKDIVQKIRDNGVVVDNVKGGGKIKVEDGNIFVWGKSSVYGEISFTEVLNILKESFPDHKVVNQEPQA